MALTVNNLYTTLTGINCCKEFHDDIINVAQYGLKNRILVDHTML